MSKLTSLIRRAPKRFSAVALMIAAAIIIPTAALAWGPDRTVYHWNSTVADHVVFNSFIDNPVQGDERNFMQVREVNAPASSYADTISVEGEHEYVINMYYHNNASTTLNDAAHNYAGVAHGAYVKAQIPSLVPKGSNGTEAEGYIGATNANPLQVWDEVSFKNTTSADIALYYVPGSTTIHNFGPSNGQVLSDSIVTTGAPIGYNNPINGDLPGCNEFSGYVTFHIKTKKIDFTLNKMVRVAGQTEYKDSVTANPGDTLEYRIEYANTGTVKHANVLVKDTLPAHVTYLAGTSTIKNGNYPNGNPLTDALTTTGVNIGDYNGGANAFVKFNGKIGAKETLPCGTTTLVNKASVTIGGNTKEDTASAVVNVECKTTECKPGIPTGDARCTECLPGIPAGDKRCELPHTGPTENIVAIVGLGALIASLVYYIASRRALNQ